MKTSIKALNIFKIVDKGSTNHMAGSLWVEGHKLCGCSGTLALRRKIARDMDDADCIRVPFADVELAAKKEALDKDNDGTFSYNFVEGESVPSLDYVSETIKNPVEIFIDLDMLERIVKVGKEARKINGLRSHNRMQGGTPSQGSVRFRFSEETIDDGKAAPFVVKFEGISEIEMIGIALNSNGGESE